MLPVFKIINIKFFYCAYNTIQQFLDTCKLSNKILC